MRITKRHYWPIIASGQEYFRVSELIDLSACTANKQRAKEMNSFVFTVEGELSTTAKILTSW